MDEQDFYKNHDKHRQSKCWDYIHEIFMKETGEEIGESYESFDHKRVLVKYQSQSDVIKVMLNLNPKA